MTEDLNTKDLSDRELFELMRRDLVSMHQDFNSRLEKLEARTNPLPPNYDVRFTALENDVKELKREMKLLRKHDFQREGELQEVIERVDVLEEAMAA